MYFIFCVYFLQHVTYFVGLDEVSSDAVLNITAKKANSKRKKMSVRLVRQTKTNNDEVLLYTY
jgi:hypothetical protein